MDVIDAPAGFSYGTASSGEVPTFEDELRNLSQPVASIEDSPAPGSSADPSFLSSAYWRGKIAEFQTTMDAMDRAYGATQAAMFQDGAINDPETWNALSQSLADYDAKKWQLRTTAEAINLGVQAVNAAGGSLSNLRLPGSLGFAPAVPVVAIAALGTAAVLIAWGREWIAGVNSRLKFAQALAAQTDPKAAARLAAQVATVDAAQQAANGSMLGALAPLAKWALLLGGAYLAWRVYDTHGRRLLAR